MNKTPKTVFDAIQKFLSMNMNNRIAIKRSYDDWTIKQLWHERKQLILVKGQCIDLVAHQRYGSDLAVADFVLSLGGQIKNDSNKWISKKRDLPPDYSKSFKLTALKMNKTTLVTEGIDNLVGLKHLEWLDLSENQKIDDFACDMLGKQFRNSKTLREIHLSYNPRITIYGLEALFRIPSVRKIVAIETLASEHDEVDSFVLAAEDERSCDVFLHKSGRKFKLDELEELRFDVGSKTASQ